MIRRIPSGQLSLYTRVNVVLAGIIIRMFYCVHLQWSVSNFNMDGTLKGRCKCV